MNREIRKLRQSFACAVRGFTGCMRTERNFRIHLTAAAYVSVFAGLARLGAVRYALLCLCFALMMAAELLNTAVERLCDRQAVCYDSLVREAKDIAAAAVFVCALFCTVIGAALFLHDGAFARAITYFMEHLWAAGLLAASLPAGIWFVFRYGRR